jgi:hypothetical protein
MKIVSVASYTTPTYDYFRHEVGELIAQAKVKNLSEAQLRAMVEAAVEGWRAKDLPKSWIVQARTVALREVAGTLLDNHRTPRRFRANAPAPH